MLRRALTIIALAILSAPFGAIAQDGPGLLPPTPTMSDLGSVTRQRQAFAESGAGVARVYLQFDGTEVTSLFEKKNPQFVNWFAASNNNEWDRRARKMKPVTTPAEAGNLVIRSRWNSSAFNRNATCNLDDFGPGYYEVFMLNSSGTSEAIDMSKDNFICSIHILPLSQEVLNDWINTITGDQHDQVRECSDNNGNVAGPQFWGCIGDYGIDMPTLDPATIEKL